ncbi:hypothetical protein, partial [Escherichia coli]|uniref:hypothetical protein n=1 Tax=Escherichia coli TaxID=562 RepID=UPI001A7E5F56
CKLLGINERHPCLSPKASLRLGKFVPDEFVTRLSRYSPFQGQRKRCSKRHWRFVLQLELFRVFISKRKSKVR